MEQNWIVTIVELLLILALVLSSCCLAELVYFHTDKVIDGNVEVKRSDSRVRVYTGVETLTCSARLHDWVRLAVGDPVQIALMVGDWSGIEYSCWVTVCGPAPGMLTTNMEEMND